MTKPNERVGLDITSVKVPNNIMATETEPHWRIIVDEKTGMKFSDFYKTMNQMVEPTARKILFLESKRYTSDVSSYG